MNVFSIFGIIWLTGGTLLTLLLIFNTIRGKKPTTVREVALGALAAYIMWPIFLAAIVRTQFKLREEEEAELQALNEWIETAKKKSEERKNKAKSVLDTLHKEHGWSEPRIVKNSPTIQALFDRANEFDGKDNIDE